ncbi:transposase InsO family protein [Mycobacterium sp. URHB0021]
MKELAAEGIPVAVTCRVLNLARQPYYRWLAQPFTDAELAGAHLANALFDAHRDDPEFGYRFLVAEADDAGQPMAERTAPVRTTAGGVRSGSANGAKTGKVGPPVHDDLAGRDFTADAPNRLRLSDITEHRTGEGKLYLCAIKDVYSNRIVGYRIDSRMKSRLATTALASAVARRGDVVGCLLHSDRGSQFRSRKFVHALGRYHLVGSMGRDGAAGDNAAMESFFSLLQNNVLDRHRWDTREHLRTAIVTWIERTYHRRSRQAGLGRLTPVEFEAADPNSYCKSWLLTIMRNMWISDYRSALRRPTETLVAIDSAYEATLASPKSRQAAPSAEHQALSREIDADIAEIMGHAGNRDLGCARAPLTLRASTSTPAVTVGTFGSAATIADRSAVDITVWIATATATATAAPSHTILPRPIRPPLVLARRQPLSAACNLHSGLRILPHFASKL